MRLDTKSANQWGPGNAQEPNGRGLVTVAIVVYVAGTLQGDGVLRDRAILGSLGLGLRLANSLL